MNNGGRLGVLVVEVRRHLYEVVRRRRHPVSRDEAAAALGISRGLAAFHLDRLVDAGLLRAQYARPSGRGGPGAGRPAKLYEPTGLEVEFSLPPRRYDVSGEILLDALATRRRGEDARAAAERVARARGVEIGHSERTAEALHEGVGVILRRYGFDPYDEDEHTTRLDNCPFDRLARRSPDLVCALTRAFLEGVLRGLGDQSTEAVLEPRPEQCCVVLRRADGAA